MQRQQQNRISRIRLLTRDQYGINDEDQSLHRIQTNLYKIVL